MSSPDSFSSTDFSSRVLLIGDPVDEVVAVAALDAGFQSAGLAVVTRPQQVRRVDLPQAIQSVRGDPAVQGVAVAMPLTRPVRELVDDLEGDAKTIGAVNTISRRGGALVGWNTDVSGFAQALQAPGVGYDPTGRSALVLGAGGAGRAVVDVLRRTARRLWVTSLDLDEARALCRDLEVNAGGPTPLGSLSLLVPRCELVVNATPAGMDGTTVPFSPEWLGPDHLVFDLIYDPPVTPLLHRAQSRGARTVNGQDMHVHQAAAAVGIWTGRKADEVAMREALRRAGSRHE